MPLQKFNFLSNCLFVFFFVSSGKNLVDAENIPISLEEKKHRPVIYTFSKLSESSNCLPASDCPENESDKLLLSLWKEEWSYAGWNPVVLTLKDAEKHADYEKLKAELDSLRLDTLGNLAFSRWIAMAAVGGGWYADYDAFPIREFSSDLPNSGRMTVYDIASPTLASGSAKEWLLTVDALLGDAKNHQHTDPKSLTFWTDSLGVLSLMRTYENNKSPTPQTAKRVANPYGKKDPILTDSACDTKPFRGRWVVHFGLEMVQGAQFVPPELRLPKHRVTLAKNWLFKWKEKCSAQHAIPEKLGTE
jgi:hypothetical protein